MVGVAPSGRSAFDLVTERHPDVVLVDVAGRPEGFLLAYGLSQLARPRRVVLHVARRNPRLQVAAWVSGVSGFASEATSAAWLAHAIRSAAAGRRTLPRPPVAAVRAAGRQLAPVDLAIFGMRMHDVPPEDISTALRVDPVEVDRRVRSLVELLGSDA